MKISIKYLAYLTVLLCAYSCGKPEWNKLRDGNIYYGILDDSDRYYWEGKTIGVLPSGTGVLASVNKKGKVKERKMTLSYGTSTKYPYPSIKGGKYLGDNKKRHGDIIPHGFGVLIEGDMVYCGTFKSGELNGTSIYQIENDKVIFKGDFVNGRREGNGEEYQDGELVYKGEWKNGVKEGRGTQYKDGSVVYDGKWTNGAPSSGTLNDDKVSKKDGWKRI